MFVIVDSWKMGIGPFSKHYFKGVPTYQCGDIPDLKVENKKQFPSHDPMLGFPNGRAVRGTVLSFFTMINT